MNSKGIEQMNAEVSGRNIEMPKEDIKKQDEKSNVMLFCYTCSRNAILQCREPLPKCITEKGLEAGLLILVKCSTCMNTIQLSIPSTSMTIYDFLLSVRKHMPHISRMCALADKKSLQTMNKAEVIGSFILNDEEYIISPIGIGAAVTTYMVRLKIDFLLYYLNIISMSIYDMKSVIEHGVTEVQPGFF